MTPILAFLLASAQAAAAQPAAPLPAQATAAEPAQGGIRTLATISFAGGGRIAAADLIFVPDDRLFLRTRDAAGGKIKGIEIATVDAALEVLADRRLAPFWPALLEFAGPDLARLRDRSLARTEAGTRLGMPQASATTMRELALAEGWALAAIQRLEAMVQAGRFDEGMSEAKAALAAASARSEDSSRFMLRSSLAWYLAGRDRTDEGLAVLEQGEKNLRVPLYAVNYWLTRAAILAGAGRYGESLALADATIARIGKRRMGDIYWDAHFHFAWIRACALKGLGRGAEAASLLPAIAAADAELAPHRLRAYACLGDESALAAELVRQLGDEEMPASAAWLLQRVGSSREPGSEIFRRAASRADVRAAFDARARTLPAELGPAMRHWSASQE